MEIGHFTTIAFALNHELGRKLGRKLSSMKTSPDARHLRPFEIPRRRMLQMAGLSLLGLAGCPWPEVIPAVAEEGPPAPLEPLNRFPRMMQEYFVGRLRQFELANRQGKAAIASRLAVGHHKERGQTVDWS